MKIKLCMALFLITIYSTAFSLGKCKGWTGWVGSACQGIQQILNEGDNSLYLSGYAWHNRASYSRDRINGYNEQAWGGGFGKSLYDEKDNLHALYAIAFLDSHKNIEPWAGYSYLKTAHLSKDFKLGAGLTVFVTARPDIFNNIPFPGILPWVSAIFQRASLSATYVPGSKGAGNVLFILGQWQF
jgi:palmitoyl transferase